MTCHIYLVWKIDKRHYTKILTNQDQSGKSSNAVGVNFNKKFYVGKSMGGREIEFSSKIAEKAEKRDFFGLWVGSKPNQEMGEGEN